MGLPELRVAQRNKKRMMLAFGGVNYAEGVREGELQESKGLSSAEFPAISQRKGRVEVRRCTTPNAIFAWGKLCVVDGTSLLYDGVQMGTVSDGPKEFAVVNTKLCIFPDKKCLDLSTKEFYDLQATRSSVEGAQTTFSTSTLQMKTEGAYGNLSSTGNIFGVLKNSDKTLFIYRTFYKQYDSVAFDPATKQWTTTGEKEVEASGLTSGKYMLFKKSEISGTYLLNQKIELEDRGVKTISEDYKETSCDGFYGKITGVSNRGVDSGWDAGLFTDISYTVLKKLDKEPGFSSFFKVGDRITVSGAEIEKNNIKKAVIRGITDGNDYATLTFDADIFQAGSQTKPVVVTREIPDLKFICESGNRLWGCEGHTIWASALGDPTHFYDYDGLSTDSYTAAVGTDGEFTGCVGYSGAVLFWKEQCLHKAMGSYPAEYAVFTYNIDGVQAGSHKSLEIVNEVLYYKGRSGVYAYTGGTPMLISAALGNRKYSGAAGGSDGRRYYISMREGAPNEVPPPTPTRYMPRGARVEKDEQWGLYVYDIQNRLWLREGGEHILEFANMNGVLHALNAAGEVWRLEQESGEAVEWVAEFAPFTEEAMERKRPLRILLRMELDTGSTVLVEVRHDTGPWRRAWSTGGIRSRTLTIPLMPRRCDQYAVRVSGVGRCKLLGLEREYQLGGTR